MSARAIAVFTGFFFAVCTVIALVFAGIDAITAKRHEQWPNTTARLTSAAIEKTQPVLPRSTGVSYHLAARALFAAGPHIVRGRITAASVGLTSLDVLTDWVKTHPRGSMIRIRYNPEQPSDAELADPTPVPRSYHAADDLRLAALFALGSVVLISASRRTSS